MPRPEEEFSAGLVLLASSALGGLFTAILTSQAFWTLLATLVSGVFALLLERARLTRLRLELRAKHAQVKDLEQQIHALLAPSTDDSEGQQ